MSTIGHGSVSLFMRGDSSKNQGAGSKVLKTFRNTCESTVTGYIVP
jgi:hypothetical protein